MQRHSALLAAGLCAACLGAGLALQQNGAATPGNPKPPAAVRQQEEIDKAKAPKLAAVAAPKDLGERAFEHVRTVVGFGPDSGNKFITTYFRTRFNVAGLASIAASSARPANAV